MWLNFAYSPTVTRTLKVTPAVQIPLGAPFKALNSRKSFAQSSRKKKDPKSMPGATVDDINPALP